MSFFNKDVLMGINIAVKSASRKFPFIVGFEFPEKATEFELTTYINILIDKKKLSEYFKEEEVKEKPYSKKSASLNSFFITPDPWENKEEWSKSFDYFFNIKKEIRNKLNDYYESVPQEYQRLSKYKHLVELDIDNFELV